MSLLTSELACFPAYNRRPQKPSTHKGVTHDYTTKALSTGSGRDGRTVVQESGLDFTMTAPKEMGVGARQAGRSGLETPVRCTHCHDQNGKLLL
ncbi:hypothetical protein FNY88_12235 [Corynebacterium guaraldiae]|uniref:Uncharacterized protein n=1 Tax=Corynebacterium guaraldiae TaxID=3051103 RepID=A0ABY3CR26_9CORY|nr:hypothetical protein FNY88_12235 [Corynebacterium guaraldiae]